MGALLSVTLRALLAWGVHEEQRTPEGLRSSPRSVVETDIRALGLSAAHSLPASVLGAGRWIDRMCSVTWEEGSSTEELLSSV